MKRLRKLNLYSNIRSQYNFKDLINAYKKGPIYTIIDGESYRDYDNGGELIIGPTIQEKIDVAAIVPFTREEYKLDEGGAYKFEDRKMYAYKKLKKGSKIKYKNKYYTVLEAKDYSDFDKGLFIYALKRGENN